MYRTETETLPAPASYHPSGNSPASAKGLNIHSTPDFPRFPAISRPPEKNKFARTVYIFGKYFPLQTPELAPAPGPRPGIQFTFVPSVSFCSTFSAKRSFEARLSDVSTFFSLSKSESPNSVPSVPPPLRPLCNSPLLLRPFLAFLGIWYLAFGHFSSSFAAESGAVSKPFVPAAKPAEEKPFSEADWVDDRWTKTDIGQFLHFTVQTPRKTTPKAITIKVGDNNEASVCFDTDLLRYSAGWTGGFLKIPDVRYGLMAPCAPAGEIQFTTEPGPGWARNDSFADPRKEKLGPLPRDWAKYKGLYRSGNRVLLSYHVEGSPVFETPWFTKIDGIPVFTRTFEIPPSGKTLSLKVAELPEVHDLSEIKNSGRLALSFLGRGTSTIGIAAISLSGAQCSIGAVNSAHTVHIPSFNAPTHLKLSLIHI